MASGLTQTILTHDPCFGKLGREIARFANHAQRFVRASQKFRPILEDASEWSEGAAPLDSAPRDPRVALEAIDRFARSRREDRATLFGAFFAHHYLRQQAETSRRLLRESFDPDAAHRMQVCREIYVESGAQRRTWVGALLEKSLAASAPDLAPEDYVALNVGALTDHEDVDLAVVCASEEAQRALARGFAGVSRTFVRFASKIQLFLTEGFASPTTGGLLSEYATLLEEPNRQVISVMQLLGAQQLCGNDELNDELRERVTRKFYAGMGSPLVHEGFMRAVMQELRVFMRPSPVPGIMAPKREIYYPAKLACTGARVMHGVETPLVPLALEQMAALEPGRADNFSELGDVFVQIEVLRALVFLYVFSGDELDLSDALGRSAVRRVALLMGLGESARRMPEERLLGMYTDLRGRALQAVTVLARDFERHLERISTFRRMVDADRPPDRVNLVEQLLAALEQHRGSVFWDEVVGLISGSPERRQRFLSEFEALSDDKKEDVARRYVQMMVDDAASLIDFLVFLSARGGDLTDAPSLFWRALMDHLSANPDQINGFIERLDADTRSEALFRLAVAYAPGQIAHLADFLEREDGTMRSARVVRTLRAVTFLVHHRSNAVGRITNRVLARSPDFLRRLGDTRRLKQLTVDILNQAAREPDPNNQIELLGDSFDVAFLRASLLAILEGAPSARDLEFTGAVDRYVRELFKACFREVRQRSPMFELYRPGFGIAVFATGGYGRGEAFGGDFDYIALVNHDDPGLKKFFGKVLQRMAMAMSRRGLHPHNRYTDVFNAWAVTVPELEAHISTRTSETFIDEAEVTEARFFLGDQSLARTFTEQVQGRVLGPNRRGFIEDLIREIRERRPYVPKVLSLKEGRGGLRELNLLFLALRAFGRLTKPFGVDQVRHLEPSLPGAKEDLEYLLSAHHEVRRLRELYRLSVAFDDAMEPEALVVVSHDVAPLRRSGVRPALRERIQALMDEVAHAVDRVSSAIFRALDRES